MATKGRWPSNFVVQHLPGCKRTGRVAGTFAYSAPETMANDPTDRPYHTNVIGHGHSLRKRIAPDEEEVVEEYECEPGCPVAEIGIEQQRYFNVLESADWVYCPKPSTSERNAGTAGLTPPDDAVKPNGRWPQEWADNAEAHEGEEGYNWHASVKPLSLMEHFIKLTTPPGGKVLDPFVGSGTTVIAAALNGFESYGIDRDPEYVELAKARLEHFVRGPAKAVIECGDSAQVLPKLPPLYFDSMITDPPAGIALAGLDWDKDKGGRGEWVTWLAGILKEAKRTLKPGAYAVVWSFPRTSHWTAEAVERAGFDIETVIAVANGRGFPKGKNVANDMKSPDKEKWSGWNTTLRAGCELWFLAKRPISEPTVAANILKWGVGALNIDAARTRVIAPEVDDGTVSLEDEF